MLTHLSRGLTSTVDQAKSLSPHGDALFVDLPFFIAMSPRSKRQLSPRDMPLDTDRTCKLHREMSPGTPSPHPLAACEKNEGHSHSRGFPGK